jgi:hypothetical protein
MANEATVGSIAERFIATFAYDWWLGTENIDDTYTKKIDELVKAFDVGKRSEQNGAAARAKRTSQLTLSMENYTGKYENPGFGTLEIYSKDNTLFAKQGMMEAVITPFTEQETVRVELIPGQGQVIKFKKTAEGKIDGAVLGGQEFKKTK